MAAALITGAACSPSVTEEGVLPEGPPQGGVVDLEFDPEGDRLLRAYPQALQRSDDGGVTWDPVALPASVARGSISDVGTPAGAQDVLYVAGPGIGVLRSEDGGSTWAGLNDGLPGRAVLAFAAHAGQPGTLFAFLENDGIYRSEDSGESWERMDAGPGVAVRRFLHSGMEGSMQTGWLFAATDEGVRRSMDCFCGWRPTGEIPGGAVYDVAYDPRQPERVYAATADGVFVSEDGGEAWEPTTGDAPAAVAITVDAAGVVHAATEEGMVFRSADTGRSWVRTGA